VPLKSGYPGNINNK